MFFNIFAYPWRTTPIFSLVSDEKKDDKRCEMWKVWRYKTLGWDVVKGGDWKDVDEELRYSIQIKECGGDGSCFYHVIKTALELSNYNTPTIDMMQLRTAAADALRKDMLASIENIDDADCDEKHKDALRNLYDWSEAFEAQTFDDLWEEERAEMQLGDKKRKRVTAADIAQRLVNQLHELESAGDEEGLFASDATISRLGELLGATFLIINGPGFHSMYRNMNPLAQCTPVGSKNPRMIITLYHDMERGQPHYQLAALKKETAIYCSIFPVGGVPPIFKALFSDCGEATAWRKIFFNEE